MQDEGSARDDDWRRLRMPKIDEGRQKRLREMIGWCHIVGKEKRKLTF